MVCFTASGTLIATRGCLHTGTTSAAGTARKNVILGLRDSADLFFGGKRDETSLSIVQATASTPPALVGAAQVVASDNVIELEVRSAAVMLAARGLARPCHLHTCRCAACSF